MRIHTTIMLAVALAVLTGAVSEPSARRDERRFGPVEPGRLSVMADKSGLVPICYCAGTDPRTGVILMMSDCSPDERVTCANLLGCLAHEARCEYWGPGPVTDGERREL